MTSLGLDLINERNTQLLHDVRAEWLRGRLHTPPDTLRRWPDSEIRRDAPDVRTPGQNAPADRRSSTRSPKSGKHTEREGRQEM